MGSVDQPVRVRYELSLGPDPGEGPDRPFLPIMRDVALLLALYTYFTGWAYLYLFYREFGFSLAALEIPWHRFHVYAYDVVLHNPVQLGAALVVFGGVMAWAGSRDRWMRVAATAMAVALFPLAYSAAEDTALRNSTEIREGRAHSVSPILSESEGWADEIVAASREGKLLLIGQTPGRYLFLLDGEGFPGTPELPTVIEVARSALPGTKIIVSGRIR